jgi:hypothetical protein
LLPHRRNSRKTAEKDFTRVRKKEELNELRDCINKMRLENDKSELTEDELPTVKEDVIITYYADVVIHAVWDSYKKGTVLESGSRVWY